LIRNWTLALTAHQRTVPVHHCSIKTNEN
jgi:hypothetical protein